MSAVNPVITNVSPAAGAISTQTLWQGRVSLSATDGHIIRIILMVEFPLTGVDETAYRNGGFTAAYTGKSTLVQTSPGIFDITLIRNGGWPSSPNVFVHANSDAGGMTE